MAASITDVVKVGTTSWKYTWTIATAPSSIFLDGELLAGNLDNDVLSYNVGGSDEEEAPVLEITDSADLANVKGVLTEQFPPFAKVQWRSTDTTIDHFVVQQKISSTWTTVKRISDSDSGYYQYKSDKLDDETTHYFRIQAVDIQSYVSPYAQFELYMVRVPDAPSIQYHYATGTPGTLTICARPGDCPP